MCIRDRKNAELQARLNEIDTLRLTLANRDKENSELTIRIRELERLLEQSSRERTVQSLIDRVLTGLEIERLHVTCLLYTSPSPRDQA
eukprot:TRINITY_DN13390_c0_g1_i2.p1 TRINITY_DN13390_c0_g1~~TRINITY_DN13390_c0_g1_i2.p1  ORF type:complete len:100 (-),score=35.84 TRINITY_DN13390_c0_g1_i2:29-292(-)